MFRVVQHPHLLRYTCDISAPKNRKYKAELRCRVSTHQTYPLEWVMGAELIATASGVFHTWGNSGFQPYSGSGNRATATWLWTELNKLGLPVICIDARHAKAALKMQINKSDRNDAVGIARIMAMWMVQRGTRQRPRQSRGQGPSRQQSSTRQDQGRSREPDPRAPQEPRARYWPSEDECIWRPCCEAD
jgi:hypothetical protein